MAGHYRPLFLGFERGGKIVATTGGVGLALAPLAFLCGGGLWIAIFLLTRYASVASILGALTLPFWALLFDASWPVVAFCTAAALAIIVLHRGNIRAPGERNGEPDGAQAPPVRPWRYGWARSQSLSSVWRPVGSPVGELRDAARPRPRSARPARRGCGSSRS